MSRMKYESPKLMVELFLQNDILTVSNTDNDIADPWE